MCLVVAVVKVEMRVDIVVSVVNRVVAVVRVVILKKLTWLLPEEQVNFQLRYLVVAVLRVVIRVVAVVRVVILRV